MIGVFDSGVGGLTVVKEILKTLPQYQIIYFGDTARLPYGTKGADFVKRYSIKISQWLVQRRAKLLVIACHTSSAWAADSLKRQFKKVPIFEMISPGAKQGAKLTKNGKIGIIGTPGTIKSCSWQKKLLELNPELKIYSKSCPLFVPLVEEGWVDKKITKEIAKEYLEPLLKKEIDTLILACTHYPVLEKVIRQVLGPRIKIINPAESLAKELSSFLKDNAAFSRWKRNSAVKHQFFFSDEPYNLSKISRLCLKTKINPIITDPF